MQDVFITSEAPVSSFSWSSQNLPLVLIENYLNKGLAIVSCQALGLAGALLTAGSARVALHTAAVFVFSGGIMMFI